MLRDWLRRGLRLLLALALLRVLFGLLSAGWMLMREPVLLSSQLLAGLLLMAAAATVLGLALWRLRPARGRGQAPSYKAPL